MRTTPVRQVIVDAVTSLALLFQRVGQTGEVAVVVVAPHQRHVVGHPDSVLIDIKHLLVGDKDGGSPTPTLPSREGVKHFVLFADDVAKSFDLFFRCPRTFHRTIVNASHTQCVDGIHIAGFIYALLPIVQHALSVGEKVIVAHSLRVPLSHIVAQHRLAVARTHVDAELPY